MTHSPLCHPLVGTTLAVPTIDLEFKNSTFGNFLLTYLPETDS